MPPALALERTIGGDLGDAGGVDVHQVHWRPAKLPADPAGPGVLVCGHGNQDAAQLNRLKLAQHGGASHNDECTAGGVPACDHCGRPVKVAGHCPDDDLGRLPGLHLQPSPLTRQVRLVSGLDNQTLDAGLP